MKAAEVLYNGKRAGILSKSGKQYRFEYDKNYLLSASSRPVSLTMPLQQAAFESEILFPAFINRLSEGANKQLQQRLLKIEENDYFSLLLETASNESIGPLTIKALDEPAGN